MSSTSCAAQTRAHADGFFEIVLSDRTARVPVPRYRMPDVPKISAGYFAAPGMDLIDLFIGSEGTLGVITEVTLRVLPARPAMCLAFVPFDDRAKALAFVAAAARRRAPRPGARAIRAAWTSRRSSTWTRAASRCCARTAPIAVNGVTIPAGAAIALLVTLELPPDMTAARAFDEIGRAREPKAPDTPLIRFCRALDDAGVLDQVEIAVPGDRGARASAAGAARSGAGRRQRARRPRQRRSTRASPRRRPT